LEKSLGAASTGKVKPSQTALAKLTEDLARTLPGTKPSASGQAWLATELVSMVKGTVTTKDMDRAATGVHDFLRDAGAGRVDAMVVKNDLKGIIVELQQAAAK